MDQAKVVDEICEQVITVLARGELQKAKRERVEHSESTWSETRSLSCTLENGDTVYISYTKKKEQQ